MFGEHKKMFWILPYYYLLQCFYFLSQAGFFAGTVDAQGEIFTEYGAIVPDVNY